MQMTLLLDQAWADLRHGGTGLWKITLTLKGPHYGYFPKSCKTWILIKQDVAIAENAKEVYMALESTSPLRVEAIHGLPLAQYLSSQCTPCVCKKAPCMPYMQHLLMAWPIIQMELYTSCVSWTWKLYQPQTIYSHLILWSIHSSSLPSVVISLQKTWFGNW